MDCGGPVSDAGTVSRAATWSTPKPAEPNGYTRPSSGRIIWQRHLTVQAILWNKKSKLDCPPGADADTCQAVGGQCQR